MEAIDRYKAEKRDWAKKARAHAMHVTPQAAQKIASYADEICAWASHPPAINSPPIYVAGYWPIQSELSDLLLLKALKKRGCHVALPITGVAGTKLVFHLWDGCDAGDDGHGGHAGLEAGPYGTKQPSPTSPQIKPDLILVPLLAFDEDGQRLGYGGGFYDRTLADFRQAGHKVKSIGIAYDQQKCARLATDMYDQPLEAILTPSGLFPTPLSPPASPSANSTVKASP